MSLRLHNLKLKSLLQELSSEVEEYQTLKTISDDASVPDGTLKKIVNLLKYMELEFEDNADLEQYAEFETSLEQYNSLLDQLGPSGDQYRFDTTKLDALMAVPEQPATLESVEPVEPVESSPSPKKSVRFNDNVVESISQQPYEPYKDDDTSETSSIGMSNRQLFITNEQELLNQDRSVEHLSESIGRQHAMSLQINDEVNDHLVLLDDLEAGMDRTNARLVRGRNNIRRFREALSERKDWATILVLIFVLLFLLIVLK